MTLFSVGGLSRIATLVTADVTLGLVGTGTGLPSATQTGLVAPVIGTQATLTTQTGVLSTQFTYTLNASSGTGVTYREYGQKGNAGAVNYDRMTFPSYTQNGSNTLIVTKVYYYTQAP